MFSLFDILSFGIILVVILFLFILFQLEKALTKPRIYLRAALFLLILIILFEELIFLKKYPIVIWTYPLFFSFYFMIYPLIYYYSRELVFNGKDKNRPHVITVLVFPFLIFIFSSISYFPLDYNSKIEIVNHHISGSLGESNRYSSFQLIALAAYYVQTVFYIVITLKLISTVKKNINSSPWEMLLVKYILLYVIAVVIFEVLVFISITFLTMDNYVIMIIQQLLSLSIIFLGVFIGFKQSLIIMQSRMNRYSVKLETGGGSQKVTNILLESEKQGIKEAIDNYFIDSRIYLDPNLKIENLSKKIHIPLRKISIVINNVYGTNFNNFINEYRISEAKRLISQNPEKINIENIYVKAGFNSRSAFYRVFKLSTGISPADYIKNPKPDKS